MSSKYYRAFGINIKSEIDFGALILEIEKCEEDIKISIGQIPEKIKKDIDLGKWISVSENDIWFDIPDTAIFYISNSENIIVQLYKDCEINNVIAYILGACMGFILYQQKKLAIHGGCVALNNKAAIICGNTGAGKTSLITALRLKGKKVLSDDISVVNKENKFLVSPGYCGQKISSDVLKYFNIEENKKFKTQIENKDKYIIPIRESYEKDSISLEAIIMLEQDNIESVKVKKVLGNEKINIILNNIYLKQWINKKQLLNLYFKTALDLAKQVPIYIVKRPNKGFTMQEQISVIEEIIK